MKCPRCQSQNREGATFCEDCGARLELACPNCGEALTPGKKFCASCGTPVTPPPTVHLQSPRSYTPSHLAEKILTSKAALEGERKQVTVLFADLKGSMELLADRDPEDARKLLDPVLERMMEAVHRYEGTVNQVMGDGIMALFGAPLAHEDHAVRACYAALRMQESIKRYAEGVRRTEGVLVQIRVGLNSGEVVVRSVGSDLHMDYTAVGQTTHLAARMEQLAAPGSVLVTGETLRLAEGYVDVTPLGPMTVKGVREPVEAFELTGMGAVRSRLQAAVGRGLSRFVGREAELEQIRRALDQAKEGRGQLAAVVGEPGVGKSRLFFEFTHSHRLDGWLALESGSVSYGKATGYLPVIDLLKAYFKISDRDVHREIREKVTGKILTLDRALEPVLPALFALLDVPVDDPRWEALDPPQRRLRTLDAVKRLVLRESQAQPVVLIFEDLHWIDSETQAVLDGLVESLPTARLLLLVNYRPEYTHAWGSKTYYTQLRLDILPPETAGELLHALLGDDGSLDPLKGLLTERTAGNPLFLEESVRALVETGALAGERGAHRLARPLDAIRVPATVQAILAARIDRLPSGEKHALQAASVIGKDVPFALLQAITDEGEDTLRHRLGHLQAAEFLYEAALFPDLEYTFKHALTHEVAYGSLLHDRRRALHARIADAIEQYYPDRLVEQIDRIAYHAFRGEVWDRALTYLRQAGTKAFGRSANRESAACFEQALEALQHLPESRETIEQGIDIRFDLRTSILPLGEVARMRDHLRDAQALAEALGDQRRLARAFHYQVIQCLLTRDYDEGVRAGEQALAIATALGDRALEIPANSYLGLLCEAKGDYRRAASFLERNVRLPERELGHQRFGQATVQSAFSRHHLAHVLCELGQFAEALVHARDAMRIAEAAEQAYTLAFAYFDSGLIHLRKGELPTAITALERGREICERGQITILAPGIAALLGFAVALSGRMGEALPLVESAARDAVASQQRYRHSLIVRLLGGVYLMAGRFTEALERAQEALVGTRRHGERSQQAYVLSLLGNIAVDREPPVFEGAQEHYHEAIALAGDLGMRPLVSDCHLGLGKLYRRTGKREQAHEHLTTATTMYREMDMPFWLERAEAEMREPS